MSNKSLPLPGGTALVPLAASHLPDASVALPAPVEIAPAPPAAARRRASTAGVSRELRGLRRADALIASGEADKALAHLRKLVAALPNSTPAQLRIAALLREKHQGNEALALLRDVVARDTQAPAAREALAETCLEMGRWDESILHARALLALTPRSLFGRDILSAAYLQSGQLDAALRVVDEMIRLDPMDVSHHFKRGVLFQQKGRIGQAVQAFGRVLKMEPEGEAADESRAALEMLDNFQIRQIITLAVEDIPFRLYLRQNPGRAIAARGYALSDMGLHALSQMSFDNLPDTPPGWRQYHYH